MRHHITDMNRQYRPEARCHGYLTGRTGGGQCQTAPQNFALTRSGAGRERAGAQNWPWRPCPLLKRLAPCSAWARQWRPGGPFFSRARGQRGAPRATPAPAGGGRGGWVGGGGGWGGGGGRGAGGKAASSCASASAASSACPEGTTRLHRPMRRASADSTLRPVRIRSSACDKPIKRRTPPPPGKTPTGRGGRTGPPSISGTPKRRQKMPK